MPVPSDQPMRSVTFSDPLDLDRLKAALVQAMRDLPAVEHPTREESQATTTPRPRPRPQDVARRACDGEDVRSLVDGIANASGARADQWGLEYAQVLVRSWLDRMGTVDDPVLAHRWAQAVIELPSNHLGFATDRLKLAVQDMVALRAEQATLREVLRTTIEESPRPPLHPAGRARL